MPYHPGCLSTVTADDYPALPGVFVQVWNGSDGDAVVVFRAYGDAPDEANLRAQLGSDALNAHEATGLTPSQLQARVAELEAAMERALQIGHTLNFEHANDPTVDHNGRTADAVLDAYNGLRSVATSVGVWTK